jgi:hypothetical protein
MASDPQPNLNPPLVTSDGALLSETHKGANPYKRAKPLQVYLEEGEYPAEEIMDMAFDDRPLSFLGRTDVIQFGTSTLFAAREKVGKSSLMRHLCQTWAADGLPVLYISEEWRRVWHRQLHLMGFQRGAGHFRVIEGIGRSPWDLLYRAKRGPEQIVVVDTVTFVLDLHLNNRDEVIKVLKQWTSLCSTGKTVILLAHLNKRGEIAGSHVFGAGVDTKIIYREVEGTKYLRTVDVEGRHLAATPEPFAVRKTGSVFTIEEVPDEVSLTLDQAKVRELLPADVDEAMDWAQIAYATGFKEGKTRTILHQLVGLGFARDVTGNLGASGGRGHSAKYVAVEEEGLLQPQ